MKRLGQKLFFVQKMEMHYWCLLFILIANFEQENKRPQSFDQGDRYSSFNS
ncbi:hypothetical protein HMPREF1557_02066 [Streptococcus sobrinus W1703]|uniref:Uncharacterized protein n=1 Tax=Streptococcus sobrinus W1703 TaxID=1227275 RepID=U2K9K1_9STRE|nr:hypothetical protein HMPREF1557_02066 [Streptococcus sobrinus W1703]